MNVLKCEMVFSGYLNLDRRSNERKNRAAPTFALHCAMSTNLNRSKRITLIQVRDMGGKNYELFKRVRDMPQNYE